MSKVKLTLTIEESVVNHAKVVAKRNRQSLSDMIENFLASTQPKKMSLKSPKMTTALKLRGIAKSTLSKKTDKEIKAMMYKEKYGI
ncbi:DUF6364 family protein [Persicitalea jodogahamensis]|uniref:Uncharacterized protein n=1 Tax=Persicitalea jodogahamensis TaxID=402147 RepID=A0A8J3D799_9BACT|nr:DUF6364 family protein [Persicitalea jodogahamensis]GHB84130.1 hypothetical protein GCM10007390_44150 [Persicitalea jodogahamensis]